MLQNQQGMYSGTPTLNPLPYVNIAMQARARKQAREEALDKYYNTLPDTINDKNVRDIEIPIIEDIKKELFEYGIKHREALKKGDAAAKLGLDQIFRKGQSVARLSQNAAKVDLTAGKSLMNKDNQFILNSDDYIADHEKHLLPVTDPNHKTLDLTKHAANRPFNSDALIKRNADIKYSDSKPQVSDHPTDPLSQIVTTKPVLDEANKKVLFDRAANDLNNNPMFANYIKNKLDKGQLDGIVKIAQEQFGLKDPSEITDEHIAAAYEYSLLPVKQTVQKRIANTEAIMDKKRKEGMEDWRTKFEAANGEWDRRRPLKFADSLALIQARNDAGGNTEDYDAGYITDDYFKKYGKQIDLKDAGWVVNGIMKGEEPAGFVPVSSIHPSDINLINGFDKEKKQLAVNPIEVNGVKGYIVKKDGDWVGDNGLIPRDRVRARNIETRMNTKFKKNEQNNKKGFGNKAPAPVKPKKDPLGLGF